LDTPRSSLNSSSTISRIIFSRPSASTLLYSQTSVNDPLAISCQDLLPKDYHRVGMRVQVAPQPLQITIGNQIVIFREWEYYELIERDGRPCSLFEISTSESRLECFYKAQIVGMKQCRCPQRKAGRQGFQFFSSTDPFKRPSVNRRHIVHDCPSWGDDAPFKRLMSLLELDGQ
jgi:hypothetical protein